MRVRALELARGALAAIEAARTRVDDLNVYPVPDGDTGTNLALTVRAVVEVLETDGSDDRAAVAREASRAALLGARGNSGVILSQVVRGFAGVLGERDDLPAALRAASDCAYAGVPEPAEGTMLTAIRELAEEAEAGGDLDAILARGSDCVVRTEAMLPALTAAGVVDAGAAGLVEIARGLAAAHRGEPLPAPETALAAAAALSVKAIHLEESRCRYCTLFVVEGEGLDRAALEAELAPLGDSLLVVGDATALKVHVHTDDPGRPLSLAVARGTVSGVEIANMQAQARERDERLGAALPDAACAAVAVAAGDGNRRLFESLGATVVDGGRTMNPSTAELLAAIDAAAAAEVVLLPNNRNVFLAAEQAAASASRPVRVLPSESLQAGLAAALAFDPASTADENEPAMRRAIGCVAAGAVTVASREVLADGLSVRAGDWVGLVAGKPVAGGGTFEAAAAAVVERLLEEPRDVLTVLLGEQPPPLDGLLADLRERHPGLALEVHEGGQPHYPLLLSAE